MWRKNSHTLVWEDQLVQPLWKTVKRCLKKTGYKSAYLTYVSSWVQSTHKINWKEKPYDQAIPLLIYIQKNWNPHVKKTSEDYTFRDHFYSSLVEKFLWSCRVLETKRRRHSALSWGWNLLLVLLCCNFHLPLMIVLLIFRGVRGRERRSVVSLQINKI